MKRIYNELFDEEYYLEKLSNGLDVLIFHKPAFITTACAFGTKYGALNIHQKLGEQEYHFHPGIAHFLEHKLFESEDQDIFTQFSNLACNVNAFTSYNETVYYFSTTSQEVEEPLNLLLDFVQNLNITKESVEKEKGIINQELSMYLQNADSRLLNETYKSMYHHFPLKHDIGGEEADVNKITKEELELCYKLNYHPSSMALVIVSPFDPEKLLKVVKDNQAKKTFADIKMPTACNLEEPLSVFRKEYRFEMDIQKAKHLYGFKLKPDFKDKEDVIFKENCMNIYLKAYFSTINPKYQQWLDEGIINDYFGYEVDFDEDYANILFYSESDEDNLKELVDNALKDEIINETILAQVKRRYIGLYFDIFNDINDFNTGYIRDYLNGSDPFETIKLLQKIELKDLKETYEHFDYSNYVLIHISPCGK